jgi:hypothetical protein
MAKRPRDINQLAKLVVDIASGETDDTVSDAMKSQTPKRGHSGGLVGGKSRAVRLTSEERAAIARKAAAARWGKS